MEAYTPEAAHRGQTGGEGEEEPTPWTPPAVSRPTGGGAIRGIGETFTTNAQTGTANMRVPIALPPSRAGLSPDLALTYDSGTGGGIFGLGWRLALPAIARRTDKGVPRYLSGGAAEDTFRLSGADLVPQEGAETMRRIDGALYAVQGFLTRFGALTTRIERFTAVDDPADCFWRTISAQNITTWFGRSPSSRIADPENPARIFRWLVSERYDDRGNLIVWEYAAEDSTGLAPLPLHEAHRSAETRAANRHVKRIRYGNRTPYRPVLTEAGPPTPRPTDFLFEVVFDYGDHDPDDPQPQPDRPWDLRADPFSTYRAGFELRTYRLCQRILVYHHAPGAPGRGFDGLVSATELTYRGETDPDTQRDAIHARLASVTRRGYARRRGNGTRANRALPALTFEYLEPRIAAAPESLPAGAAQALGSLLAQGDTQWIDLHGSGAPGLLSRMSEGWFYAENESALSLTRGTDGIYRPAPAFAPPAPVDSLPFPAAAGARLLDLSGDGLPDLVDLAPEHAGLWPNEGEHWSPHRPLPSMPNADLAADEARLVDVTGDGRPDLVVAEEGAVRVHRSEGTAGWHPHTRVPETHTPLSGFAPARPDEARFDVDVTGDGLPDLLLVRNGAVTYRPNLGHGRYGHAVAMDGAPRFDTDEQFDPGRLRTCDADGSGLSDLIYLGREGARLYLNRSGNGWTPAIPLPDLPGADDLADVRCLDLLGAGTDCLVWTSPAPAGGSPRLRFLRLSADGKPHLMVARRNGLGAETRVSYAPSPHFQLADARAGRPWATRLPFPVHVVLRTETLDHVSRTRFSATYAYHHGHYDAVEREFCGFGMVERRDTEEFGALSATAPPAANIDASSHIPPVLTKTWYHTGIAVGRRQLSRHFAGEYYAEPGLDTPDAWQLPDTVLPEVLERPGVAPVRHRLTDREIEDCTRALRGTVLRTEIYSEDGTERALHPHSVAETSWQLRLLQERRGAQSAVVMRTAREEIEIGYDRLLRTVAGRELCDPRIRHAITLASDLHGNVLGEAALAYGRRYSSEDPELTPVDHARQAAALVSTTEHEFTNGVDEADAWRCPLPAESRTFALHRHGIGAERIRFDEAEALAQAPDTVPSWDVDAATVIAAGPLRRMISHTRTRYRPDDFGAAAGDVRALLPLGRLEPLGLVGESYRLVMEEERRTAVYGARVASSLAAAGGYLDLDGDGTWCAPSGRVFLSAPDGDTPAAERAEAEAHFFLPRRFEDQFGAVTRVAYDAHDLTTAEITTPVGTSETVETDFRTLAPARVSDANANHVDYAHDAIGFLAGRAVVGRNGEGDSLAGFEPDLTEATILAHLADPLAGPAALLGRASERYVIDLEGYARTAATADPQPAVICALRRQIHDADLAPGAITPVRQGFDYSDGSGRPIQQIAEAEPGPLVEGGPMASPRWVVSGWVIFDNKNNPVRRYEPFFSDTHTYRFAPMQGVSPILLYDALGRLAGTINPDHTLSKTTYTPWSETIWDGNDMVLADPSADPDLAAYVGRLPSAETEPTWHAARAGGALGPDAQEAAVRAAVHANTPERVHFDPLGRPILRVTDNGAAGRLTSRSDLDLEGRLLAQEDGLGRTALAHTAAGPGGVRVSGYDLTGSPLLETSIDAGPRRSLRTVRGETWLSWDAREIRSETRYDAARRVVELRFIEGGTERVRLRNEYGEAQGNTLNHLGRLFRVLDGAGEVTHLAYDFKGNPLSSRRRFVADHRGAPDWAASPAFLAERFETRTRYDALDRPVASTTPDGSVLHLSFNEARLPERVEVALRGAAARQTVVSDLDHDARGLMRRAVLGNGAEIALSYEPDTLRLSRIETREAGRLLQDLRYTYDPVGNPIIVSDGAQQDVYFNNGVATARAEYVYDALYRLVTALGREHIGQVGEPQRWEDALRIPHPEDGAQMRTYTQTYAYDGAGNLQSLTHTAAGGSYTRTYSYNEASPIRPGETSNRLSTTRTGADTIAYTHDAAGNLSGMPHFVPVWDEQGRLSEADLIGGGRVFFQYDGAGVRVRKVVERQTGTRQMERLTLGALERETRFGGNGTTVDLVREALTVSAASAATLRIETRVQGTDAGPSELFRYMLGDHQGSGRLELDAAGAVISYEEYHPYGSTSYQAVRSQTDVPRRHRFAGMERDEETGLSLMGARYYAPWLGRWTAADPAGAVDGTNLYRFARNSPIRYTDRSGTEPDDDTPPVEPEYDLGPLRLREPSLGLEGSGRVQLRLNNIFSEDRSFSVETADLDGRLSLDAEAELPAFGLTGTAEGDLRLRGTVRDDQLRASLSGRAEFELEPPVLPGSLDLGINFGVEGSTRLPSTIPISGQAFNILESSLLNNLEGTATADARLSYNGTTLGLANLSAEIGSGGYGTLTSSGNLFFPGTRLSLASFEGTGYTTPYSYELTGNYRGFLGVGGGFGDFTLSSAEGFSTNLHYFGLQFGPLALTPDMFEMARSFAEAGDGDPNGTIRVLNPGATLGYSFLHLNGDGTNFIISAGVTPLAEYLDYSIAQPPLDLPVSAVAGEGERLFYGTPRRADAGIYGGASFRLSF